jgi:DNA-directed RNA polymerase subunit RPC12/RpoP
MSWIQRVITGRAPRRAGDMERESREWKVICPKCGHVRSIWELGGIRYKAWSRGKRMGMRCPACGSWRMHKVERRPTEPSGGESP